MPIGTCGAKIGGSLFRFERNYFTNYLYEPSSWKTILLYSKLAAMTNQARDAHESSVSAKDKRKARKELEAARKEYEAKMAVLAAEEEGDSGKASVSNMVIPDYRSGRNERDIHVSNVSLSLDNGTPLLIDGELKFSHQRRYGLVGKNGVGEHSMICFPSICSNSHHLSCPTNPFLFV